MFWLSSTPSVPGSNDFNNIYPKNCIWASIKKIDDYSCLYFNVEFDKNNYKNYSAMFKVLLQQIKKIMNKHKEDYFVFLGGSFYIKDNDPLFEEIIKFGFKNIDFQNNDDYLFYLDRVKQFDITQAITFKDEIIINKSKNTFLSDHLPIKIEYINNI